MTLNLKWMIWPGVLFLALLVGCGAQDVSLTPTEPKQTRVAIVQAPTASTSSATAAIVPPRAVPPARIGSFVLSRAIVTHTAYGLLPVVRIPDWIDLGEEESQSLMEVSDAYAAFARALEPNPYEPGVKPDDFITRADEFLRRFTESDGAIPVLMMFGHVSSWQGDRSFDLFGQEYERAIDLILKRHLERLPSILDDLIDLGLPINQVQGTDLGQDDSEALLFSYQLLVGFGLQGRLYTLVKEAGRPWQFAPLPTRYTQDGLFEYTVGITRVDDINRDGLSEVVTVLVHAYAGGYGIRLHVFVWRDGRWVDLMQWDPLGNPGWDAYYGRYEIEDRDGDGVQEIAVGYYTGPPMSGAPYVTDIYRWNGATYTDTLPVQAQVCGYYAFAEAQRRLVQGNLRGALYWAHQARRRWAAEQKGTNALCAEYTVPSDLSLNTSYEREYAILSLLTKQELNSDVCSYYASVPADHGNDHIEIPERIETSTETPTATVDLYQLRVNLTRCSGQPPRVVGRFYSSTTYTSDIGAGEKITCYMDWLPKRDFTDLNGDGLADLRQTIGWHCTIYRPDIGSTALFQQAGPTVETICLWNGYRYTLSNSGVISASTVITGSAEGYPQLAGIDQTLIGLVDCSGDP